MDRESQYRMVTAPTSPNARRVFGIRVVAEPQEFVPEAEGYEDHFVWAEALVGVEVGPDGEGKAAYVTFVIPSPGLGGMSPHGGLFDDTAQDELTTLRDMLSSLGFDHEGIEVKWEV